MVKNDFEKSYLSGRYLYGNDFTESQIAEWYEDEAEGYAELGAQDSKSYVYGYHEWNRYHGFSRLPDKAFDRVIGFGSAYGDELLPIEGKAKHVTIVDPSEAFKESALKQVKVDYIKPTILGELAIDSASVDLVTSFGVLHHIPNVSQVMHEISRVIKPGATFLLREPIVSLGDWRQARKGLTKRERGIPLHLIRAMVKEAGFEIVSERLCAFSLTTRIFKCFTNLPFNNKFATLVDHLLCRLFAWNINYHPTTFLERIRPMSVFFVLKRVGNDE